MSFTNDLNFVQRFHLSNEFLKFFNFFLIYFILLLTLLFILLLLYLFFKLILHFCWQSFNYVMINCLQFFILFKFEKVFGITKDYFEGFQQILNFLNFLIFFCYCPYPLLPIFIGCAALDVAQIYQTDSIDLAVQLLHYNTAYAILSILSCYLLQTLQCYVHFSDSMFSLLLFKLEKYRLSKFFLQTTQEFFDIILFGRWCEPL